MNHWLRWTIAPAVVCTATSAHAVVYLNLEQAQQAIFPGARMTSAPVKLTPPQRSAIQKASGVNVRSNDIRAWKVEGGGWFVADEVVGKHEFINFAIGITAAGAVKSIEIMEYRETYGGEVRNAPWRAQFVGKTSQSKLKLDDDIKNIGGATLSSRHIADGVKRLLVTYDVALR
jgi:hypothetical protein